MWTVEDLRCVYQIRHRLPLNVPALSLRAGCGGAAGRWITVGSSVRILGKSARVAMGRLAKP